jgi:formylglycine-generating enzyme required for sulfatase activity
MITRVAYIQNRTGTLPLFITIFILLFLGCTSSKKINSKSNHPVTGQTWTVPLQGNTHINMVWINPGTFIMGSPALEKGRKTDEGPQTAVILTKGYWLGKTELTIGQWKAVMSESFREHVIKMLNDETVYDFGGPKKKLREFMNFNRNDPDKIMANESDSIPMYFVSWDDAMEFCKKLTEREKASGRLPLGYEYTLPTEAQWEYACRAGTNTSTFAGSLVTQGKTVPVLDTIAWYNGNSSINYHGKKLGIAGAGPRNAGEKKPNAWGLQDMPGNIWEWCRDWYGTARINRGGSWGSGANDSRSANRAKNPKPEKSAYRGFRIALCVLK